MEFDSIFGCDFWFLLLKSHGVTFVAVVSGSHGVIFIAGVSWYYSI